jgi:hypothetical protein
MKKILVFTLAAILCIFFGVFIHAESPIALHIDGESVQFDESTGYPFINSENRTLMPLRACLSYIGCTVSWDQDAKIAIIRKGSTVVNVPVGESQIYVNGKVIPIDAAAVLKNGRTYLPLRAVFEAYKYRVDWDSGTKTINVVSGLTPKSINGGTTGIFSRQQFQFLGFDGIQADIRLPEVTLGQKGDCPYVYFGFDLPDDKGNTEGGFQFIEDEKNPGYNKWTVYLRQGSQWRWGDNILLAQGETHNLKFRAEKISNTQTDLVIELDGREAIRQKSTVSDFSRASVKAVAAMAMSVPFDGTNCPSSFTGCMIGSLALSEKDKDGYTDASQYELYSDYKNGIWYGTVDCTTDYLHFSEGDISIYRVSKTGARITLTNDEIFWGEVCDPMVGGVLRHELTQDELSAFIDHFNSCGIREGEREKNSVNFHNHMSDSIDVLLNMKNGEIMYVTAYYDGDISVTNEHGNDYYLHNFALQDYIINTMGKYLYPAAN